MMKTIKQITLKDLQLNTVYHINEGSFRIESCGDLILGLRRMRDVKTIVLLDYSVSNGWYFVFDKSLSGLSKPYNIMIENLKAITNGEGFALIKNDFGNGVIEMYVLTSLTCEIVNN